MRDNERILPLLDLTAAYESQLPPMPVLPPPPSGADVAATIDHTLLKPDATFAQVQQIVNEAKEHKFAAVCVNPVYAHLVSGLLRGTAVKTAVVVGFPLGATLTTVKLFETTACLEAGASEIDMVINVGALKGEAYGQVLSDIEAVVHMARNRRALVKVIIETGLLTRREKILACLISKEAGAGFVKTSTGFGYGGATVEDVDLMRRVVGAQVGVKASGGIRGYADAIAMLKAGANRLGASAGVKIIQESSGQPITDSTTAEKGY